MRPCRLLLLLLLPLLAPARSGAQRMVKSGGHEDVTSLSTAAEFAAFVQDHAVCVVAFTTGSKDDCAKQGRVCLVLQSGY